MSDTETADLLYGVAAIAEHLGVGERQVYHLAATGTLPTFKIRGKVCARRSTLATWIADQEKAARAAAPEPATAQ